MPDCHSCTRKPSAFCWQHCRGPSEPSHAGKVFVSLDAKDGHEADVIDPYANGTGVAHDADEFGPAFDAAEEHVTPAGLRASEAFGMALRAYMSLSRLDREVVALRFLDGTGSDRHSYTEIGRQYGISAQAAEARHRKALREWPALRWLFIVKRANQARKERTTCPTTDATTR